MINFKQGDSHRLLCVPEETYARRTARVLLLDRYGRILLLRFMDGKWLTPGGGVDRGESLREAAARELQEEVGLAVHPDQLGPRVAESSGHVASGWITGHCRDDFFLHRIDTHQVNTSGLSRWERKAVTGHRWWSATELAVTSDAVRPRALAPLVADLAAGRIPPSPVRLPWHAGG